MVIKAKEGDWVRNGKINKKKYLFLSENGDALYGVPYINSGDSEDYFQLKSKLFSLREIKEYLGEPIDMN
jgi:hypothetical protein